MTAETPSQEATTRTQQPTGDDVGLQLLELEFGYVTQSSFHTDDLRDKFIQYYLVIVGVAFTLMIGLIENTRVDVALFAIISVVLFLIGFVLIFVLVRLRRIVWECMAATTLIKEYYKKHAVSKQDLSQAMLWDEGSLPSEKLYSASSLLVLLVAILDSTMFGSAVFLLIARPDLNQNHLPGSLGPSIIPAIIVFVVFALFQWFLYFRRLDAEKAQAYQQTGLEAKKVYWHIDFVPGDESVS